MEAAVHGQNLAGDVGGSVGHQEDDGRGHVLGACPRGRAGSLAKTASRAFSDIASVMSVSMKPGAIALTVMPREASSRATDFVKPITPALLAA